MATHAETNRMADVLNTRHPHYIERAADWAFFLKSYEGGSAYLRSGHLFRYVKEPEIAFNERLNRAAYYNYCAPIVDVYNAHLFRQGAVRVADDQELVAFFEDVDGLGTTMEAFIKHVQCLAQIFGKYHVVVDLPAPEVEPVSLQAQNELGLRPYLVKLDPRDLVNWQLDDSGRPVWVRIRERVVEGDDPFDWPEEEWRFRTWTRTEWLLHTPRGEVIARGEHGLGAVPIATLYDRSRTSRPFTGLSTIEDIALINRQINNWASSLDEFILKQCFSHLFYPEGMFESADRSELIEFGMNNASAFPGDAQHLPFYLSPEVSPGKFIHEQIVWAVGEIYRLARLENAAGRQVHQEASGIAKAFDFQETNQTLADKAARCEACERDIIAFVQRWRGKNDYKFTVNYGRDFNIRSANEQLEEALSTIRIPGVPKVLVREQLKRIAKKILPGAPAQTIVNIEREIDAS